jgi:translation elongation factor EF-Ts
MGVYNMLIEIKKLHDKTGCDIMTCKKAVEYANGDEKLMLAYLKAKFIAVATPKMTFDERVRRFYGKN